MRKLKKFTLREFIDAIRQNKIKTTRKTLFRDKDGGSVDESQYIDSACAYGQGLINLGINMELYSGEDFNLWEAIYINTWHMNDDEYKTPQEIADNLVHMYNDKLDTEFVGYVRKYRLLKSARIND